ncbi:MAG: Maf family nucleotide pyrophosphatase [Pseudomonadota bacterium]
MHEHRTNLLDALILHYPQIKLVLISTGEMGRRNIETTSVFLVVVVGQISWEVNNTLIVKYPGIIPVSVKITLASTSPIRSQLLRSAHVQFTTCTSDFDEEPVKAQLIKEKVAPYQIALALAAGKAEHVSMEKDGLVLGCDQILALDDRLLSKPKTKDEARHQLVMLQGRDHMLLSAAVIFESTRQVWSHVGQVTLTMRDLSDKYLDMYLDRNWPKIQNSVGGYKLEEEGVRLFSKIQGDYFTVLGMPLVEVLEYLGRRGAIEI